MNTLIRNATLNMSRGSQYYETLGRQSDGEDHDHEKGYNNNNNNIVTQMIKPWSSSKRKSSTRHVQLPINVMNNLPVSLSYRRDRAKKRLIFLRSYQLSTLDSSPHHHHHHSTDGRRSTSCWGMKRVFVKAKAAVSRRVRLAWLDPLRWCGGDHVRGVRAVAR